MFGFQYSKISHLEYFRKNEYDKDIYGKSLDFSEDMGLSTYQNLLIYSYLKEKKNLNILHIGRKKLVSLKVLKKKHECSMIAFEEISKDFSNIDTNKIVHYTKIKINKLKSHFDLIFIQSSDSTETADTETGEIILKNCKTMLKPGGILLGSFTNILLNNNLWNENLFNVFAKDKYRVNELTKFSSILNDPDIFIVPENYYNRHWKEFTNKPYSEFGKAFCNNIFIENYGKVLPDDFDEFTYLKNSHISFFLKNNYTKSFPEISDESINTEKLQSLLVYSFIKSNIIKGGRILAIGKIPEYLKEILIEDYILFNTGIENFRFAIVNTGSIIHEISKNENKNEQDFNNFFDFAFGLLNSEEKHENPVFFNNITNNINLLLKTNGYSLLCFNTKVFEKQIFFTKILTYILNSDIFRINKIIKKEIINADDDLFISEISKGKSNKTFETSYNVLWQKVLSLPTSGKTKHQNKLREYPVYVFHHLMKCGGTSMFNVLDKWFKTLDDNILDEDLNDYVVKKYNTGLFHNDVCIRAHFQKEGVYLHQRYPELLNRNDEVRLFTFIRDPLSVKISKYYFLQAHFGRGKNVKLTDSLLKNNNFIASLFPCDESNYKEILDRYFFIGIVEKFQESFDLLADLTGKRRVEIPHINTSEKDSQMNEITPEFIKKFKELNVLDYRIYEYCLNKFEKLKPSN